MPVLPGILFDLPSANVVLYAVGSTSAPFWNEISPIVWWAGGFIFVAGLVYLAFVLLHKVFWGA